MKLAYEVKQLRKRVESLELYDKGYMLNGMVESNGEYMVVLIKKERYNNSN
ncbi:hypothetical protein [Clostridium sp. C8-1-8]|uniref:hypothetical protein n=1 Tax=Clostridium sp. C8-1-8 TaxID=2698831 RepID=UPI00137065D0|nr:hypothetical protein [Clostridium sp. C8-1-8]